MAIKAQNVIDQALDLTELTDSSYAVTARLQDYFNTGLSKLHYTLADSDLDWWSEEADIPITADTARYTLPNGVLYSAAPPFYKMKELYLVESDKIYSLPKFQRSEVESWEASGPRTSADLRMLYIPAYVPIPRGEWSQVDVAYAYPPGWEDYVVLFIATRLMIRSEQYERAQALAAERDQALLHVMQHAAPRDLGRPDRVQDVTGRWQSNLHWYFEHNYAYRLFGNTLEIGQPAPFP